MTMTAAKCSKNNSGRNLPAKFALAALALAVAGCAGKAEVRRMSESFRDNTELVQKDVIALRDREVELVKFANAESLLIIDLTATAKSNLAKQSCTAVYNGQLAALQEKRGDLAAEITKGAADAIGLLEKTIEDAAETSGVDAHAAKLIRESAAATNADKLTRLAADMRLATYALSVTKIENELLASSPKRIADSANRMQQRLAAAVAQKKDGLDARLAACEKDADANTATEVAAVEPIKPSTAAYDQVHAYLGEVKGGSKVWIDYLDSNGFGKNSLLQLGLASTFAGLKNALLGKPPAPGEEKPDLKTLRQEALEAVGLDADGINAEIANINFDEIKTEAGLDNPLGLLLEIAKSVIAERFEEAAPELKTEADEEAAKAVKEMVENEK